MLVGFSYGVAAACVAGDRAMYIMEKLGTNVRIYSHMSKRFLSPFYVLKNLRLYIVGNQEDVDLPKTFLKNICCFSCVFPEKALTLHSLSGSEAPTGSARRLRRAAVSQRRTGIRVLPGETQKKGLKIFSEKFGSLKNSSELCTRKTAGTSRKGGRPKEDRTLKDLQ